MGIFAKKKQQKQETGQQNSIIYVEQRQQIMGRQQEGYHRRGEASQVSAKADLSVGEEQNSKKKKEKNIAPRTLEEQHGSFSDIRRNAFQNNLNENVIMDLNEIQGDSSEEYAAVLKELNDYVRMEQNGRNAWEEGIALNNVRERLLEVWNILQNRLLEMKKPEREIAADRQIEQQKQRLEKEQGVLQRYSVYFDTFCMGQLQVTETDPLAKTFDCRKTKLTPTDSTKDIFEMKDARKIPLFTHEPSINDIHQKYLGDCYFEAALGALVSEHPERIKELMKDNGDGTVTVCLYQRYLNMEELPQTLPPHLEKIRESSRKKDFTSMSDYEILLQLFGKFQGCLDDYFYLEKKKQMKESEEMKRIEREKMVLYSKFAVPDLEQKEKDEIKNKLYELSLQEADEANQCGKRAANAVEKYFSIFRFSNSVFDSLEGIHKIAHKMSEDPRFVSICKAVREMEKGNKNGLNPEVWERVIATIKKEFSEEDLEAVKREYAGEYEALNDGHLSVQYVTVTKEIPVDKRTGKALYTDSPLWVHMYQKAYIAGNLRKLKSEIQSKIRKLVSEYEIQLKKEQPDLSMADIRKLVDKKKEEYEKYYLNSYENIESGHINDALGMINGTQVRSIEYDPVIFSNTEEEIKLLKKDEDAVMRIRGSLPQFEEQDLELFYSGITNQLLQRYNSVEIESETKRTFKYANTAITIEEIKEIVLNAQEWEENQFYSTLLQKTKEKMSDFSDKKLEELIKLQLKVLADNLEQYYDNLEGRISFQHKKFAADVEVSGIESGKYTREAIHIYNELQKALQNKKAVGIATQRFIPDEVKEILKRKTGKSGGETISTGLAEGHAYSILGCMEKGGYKYLALQNPWGNTERIYTRVTKPGKKGHPPVIEYKEEEVNLQSGQFYIELNDLMNSCDVIYGI